MIRFTAFALLACTPVLSAAPVPKEVRTNPSYIGTWQLVTLDPKDSTKRTPGGQFWVIDAQCNVGFKGAAGGAAPRPSERFQFDPKTGEVNHTLIGGTQRMLFGVYRIEGDLLTIHLNTGNPSIRPKGFALEPGCSIWHLERVEVSR